MLGQDDFVLGKKLGEGAFGVVCKASLANPEAAEKVSANVESECKRFNFCRILVTNRYLVFGLEDKVE